MAMNRPDRPIPRDEVGPEAHQSEEQEERDDERPVTADELQNPEHPDREAILRERGDGAHSEQVTDEANFRADDSPPGS